VIARHERAGKRLDELAGQEAAFAKAGRSRQDDREFGSGKPRHEAAVAVGIDQPLDPPRCGLEYGVSGRATERGVDRVEAADAEQQHDEGGLSSLPAASARRSMPAAARRSRAVSGSRPIEARRLRFLARLGCLYPARRRVVTAPSRAVRVETAEQLHQAGALPGFRPVG
jgi:hypothetical protein